MLTSQVKIAEQINRRLRNYSDENDFDEREIILAVHQSLASVVRNRYFQSKTDETGEVDGSLYYTIHNNEVKQDSMTDEYYIETPSSAIALPFGIDIQRVGKPKGYSYIEVPRGFNDAFRGMEASNLAGNIGFYRNGKNIVFTNMSVTNKPENVSITLLLPFGNLDEEDEISLPLDMIDEIVEVVFSKFANTSQIQSDEVNDSNDN